MNKEVVEEPVTTRVSPLVSMPMRDFVSTLIVGIGVGLLVAIVAFLMNKFVFGAVLCRPQSMTDCAQAPNYAMIVAMVIGAIAGVVALARLRVYRPLLIVLAATIALWGLHSLVGGLAWYWALLVFGLLFGITYGLFAWISRIRSFILALVITIVMVVIVRWVMVA